MQEAGEIGGPSFVPGDEAARVLKPGEEPFDAPPTSVASKRPAVLGDVDPVAPMGSDQFDPAVGQHAVEPVAVIRGITDQAAWVIGEETGV
jgi:hypothetical protein